MRFSKGSAVLLATLGSATVATPAGAQDITLTPLADARLRYEHVDQDGIAFPADAVTLRVRSGLQAKTGPFALLVEAQGTLGVVNDYNDGLNGRPRPIVADPQNIALYRAQLQYRDKAVALTLGRQRISLDDDRFVDAASFRQNAQTFDAIRAELTPLPKLRADVSYAWSVRTVWGIDGFGARPTAIGGPNVFAELGYATPFGTATGFAYLAGQDDPAVQAYRLSSQTWGLRFAGSQKLGANTKLSYKASYARQSDWRRNPNRYAADFYLADFALDLAALRVGAGYEVAGASNGAAFTSFQFPVGSGFRYRGWGGKFNPTPPDGLRNFYGSVGYTVPRLGRFKAVGFQAIYYRFSSDRLVRHYGDELDLLVSGKLGRYTLSARLARYTADRLMTDTTKLWLSLDWAL